MTFASLALALLLVAQSGGIEEGRRLIAEDRFDSAIVVLESWRARNPESEEAPRLLVHSLRVRARRAYVAGDLAATLRDLTRAAQLAPSDSAIVTDLATVHAIAGQRLLERGDTEGALTGFQRALELEPNRRDVRRALASIRVREGVFFEAAGLEVEAIQRWRRALDLDSGIV
jgi:tetratricopeptide (TPR) repeat protein